MLLFWQVVILVCAIGIAVATFSIYRVKAKSEAQAAAKSAMTGVIAPKSTTKVLLDVESNVWPKLELGIDSGGSFLWAGPAGQPLFSLGGDNIILEIEAGVVKISATIRDKSGSVIAQLVKNEWTVNPARSWDRNYSKDAVEVMDPTGKVVLQAVALPDRVQFSANMYGRDGAFLGMGKAGPNAPGPGGMMWFSEDRGTPIPPIFRYPSATHLGERL